MAILQLLYHSYPTQYQQSTTLLIAQKNQISMSRRVPQVLSLPFASFLKHTWKYNPK